MPFKINPLGMQPVLVAVFLCEGMMWLVKNAGARDLSPTPSRSSSPHSARRRITSSLPHRLRILLLDLQDTPKDVSEYLVKIGARVPDVRPGEQTVRHLGQLQDGARFFGDRCSGWWRWRAPPRITTREPPRSVHRIHAHAHRLHHPADQATGHRHVADAQVDKVIDAL